MGELAAIAETFSKYGAWAFVALLLVTVKVLYNRNTSLQDARLQDMKEFLREGIKAQEASAHALEQLEVVVRSLKP
jgi:hypothetical protein